jgi:hypothetical protein
MSAREVKNFRRCYFASESPGEYVVAGEDQFINGTVSSSQGSNILFQATDGSNASFLGLKDDLFAPARPGDFRLKLLTAGGATYDIDRIISNTEVLLVAPGTPSEIPAPVPVQILRADTSASQVEFIAKRSQEIDNRRANNVWIDSPLRNGVLTRPQFVAAEIAGLRSAKLPQQGLTRTEIQHSATDAPTMYNKYSKAELDYAAARGTFIVTQEAENTVLFIRHQLTTSVAGGNLFYEDSVGTNLDNISFLVKDALDGFIGQRNVNERTINDIKAIVLDILTQQTTAELLVDQIGPALIEFANVEVFVDDVFKDRINVTAQLVMPLPLNTIDVTLRASVSL